jgi:AmmeMemoRadiSam system protein B
MKKNLLVLLVLVMVFFAAGMLLCRPTTIKENKNESLKPNENQSADFHLAYSMKKESYGDIEKNSASDFDDPSEGKIYGGIVSHHLLAADEIARFFSAFKAQNPKTIVIIGPNHFNIGKGDILISKYPYQTPWGTVYPEEKYIDGLLDSKVLSNDETPFAQEHSISALVSFIKYYIPDAKIIPIIVKRNTKRERVEVLAENLNKILPGDAVVISSVDFSHHLDETSANFHDEKSVSNIENFDYDGVLSSEIDSPPSIYALLRFLEFRGAQKMAYKNTDSAELTHREYSDDVTSYLFAHFTKGGVQENKKISILNFGNILLEQNAGQFEKINPFEKIKGREGNFLRGVDFILADLAGTITDSKDCAGKARSFNSNIASLISKSGINMINLADDHMNDCGEEGIVDTKNYLSKNRIDSFGTSPVENSYTEKEADGSKIAFVGINATNHSGNLKQYYDLIKKLRETNDYLVANIRWDNESDNNLSSAQKDIAHSLIDSGADLVIGYGPYAIQPLEIYKNKVIFYSLGDLVSDQTNKNANNGLGVGTVFSKDGTRFYLFPYDINAYQPALLPPEKATIFCNQYLNDVKNANRCYFEVRPE